MARYSGVIEPRKIDRLLTSAELDREKRHALQKFSERMDRTIIEANQTVLQAKLPDVTLDTMTRLAVRIAELRASYLAKALAVAEKLASHPLQHWTICSNTVWRSTSCARPSRRWNASLSADTRRPSNPNVTSLRAYMATGPYGCRRTSALSWCACTDRKTPRHL